MASTGQGDRSRRRSRSQSPSLRNHSRDVMSMSNPAKKLEKDVETTTDSLLLSLKILQRYDKAHKQKLLAATVGKKTSPVETEQEYQFTKHMFFRNNTEALFQVIYQVLSTVYPTESAVKFRSCWPTSGDPKLQSEFRKLAYTWVVEISEAYRLHFDTKPQFAFFVTPSGLKCVRFLSCFAQCGLVILAERIQAAKNQPLIENPKFCEDPDTLNENIRKIREANEASTSNCLERLKQVNKFLVFAEQKKTEEENNRREVTQELEEQEQKINKLIQKRPELFPVDALSMVRSESRFFVPDGRDVTEALLAVDSTSANTEDKLCRNLKDEWKQKLMLLRDTYGTLAQFLTQHESLIGLLNQICANHDVTIDVKRFPNICKQEHQREKGSQALYTVQIPEQFRFIQNVFPKIEEQPYLSNTTANLTKKIQEVQNFLAAENNIKPGLKDDLLFLIKVEEIALENTDWNQLLPKTAISSPDVNLALILTPPKPRDFTQTTGLTPIFNCGIGAAAPDSKISRLMNSIHISSTPVAAEHPKISALKNTGPLSTRGILDGQVSNPLEDFGIEEQQQGLTDSSSSCQVGAEALPANDADESQYEVGIMENSTFPSFEISGLSLDPGCLVGCDRNVLPPSSPS